LGTDRIDFYQLHNPRLTALQRDDTFTALENLVEQGKVRYYGAAIGPDIGWREEGDFAIRERKIPSQIIYNVLEQDPALDFIAAANEENVGLISRVPHASGTLDGTYQKGFKFDGDDHRSFRRQQWLDKSLAKVDQLEFLLGGKEATIGQIALKYVLTPEIVASVLVTATTAEQLVEYCAASDQPDLPRAELDRVDILYADNFGMGEKDALKSSVV
jgi:aryl-alcohol dehydrogenase-like predicted oxidoreductase